MRYLVIILLSLLITVPTYAEEEFDADDFMSSIRADVEFYNGDMKKVTLKDFRDKVVVLAFWGTWCPPCVKEMPSLNRLQKDMSKEGIEVIAVAVTQSENGAPQALMDDVKAFYKKYEISNLEQYIDPIKELKNLHDMDNSLPAVAYISKSGNLITRQYGLVDWDSEFVRKKLRSYLKQ